MPRLYSTPLKILAWLGNMALWIVCLAPIPAKLPSPISRSDLFYHGLSYTLMGLLFMSAYAKNWKNQMIVALALIVQGVAIEFIQPFANRFFEYWDMAANSIGVLIGLVIYSLFRKVSGARA